MKGCNEKDSIEWLPKLDVDADIPYTKSRRISENPTKTSKVSNLIKNELDKVLRAQTRGFVVSKREDSLDPNTAVMQLTDRTQQSNKNPHDLMIARTAQTYRSD